MNPSPPQTKLGGDAPGFISRHNVAYYWRFVTVVKRLRPIRRLDQNTDFLCIVP